MPRQRITKEMVVEAAFQLAREGGMNQVLVKRIAEKIGCSVQPIYCYCENMEGLKQEVIIYIKSYMSEYINKRIASKDIFRSTGAAYALFAKEEPYLYRAYFLRDRRNIGSLKEIFEQEENTGIIDYLVNERNLRKESAIEFYNYMMIFNTGISVILSTLGEHTEVDEIVRYQTAAYEALYEYINKNKHNSLEEL